VKLLSLDLHSPGVLGDFSLNFADEGLPRGLTLVHGGPGSGKTSLVNALLCTRPGHAVAMSLRPGEPKLYARATWQLGIDEPDRKTPLLVVSPNAPEALFERDGEQRREQVFFDRLAKDGGFVFLAFSALRWFSKGPVVLPAPESTIARHDVREFLPLDDGARQDLARECKQTLTFGAIAAHLPQLHTDGERERRFGLAVSEVVSRIAELSGFRYLGVSARSLSPTFAKRSGEMLPFDALPTQVKHAIAFGALPLRALWAAYPGLEPRRAPAVVVIDQFELQQDESSAVTLVHLLRDLLPEVQWVFTTRSASLLASREQGEVLALRRNNEGGEVRVYTGSDAQLH
jgi:hypothetical protein